VLNNQNKKIMEYIPELEKNQMLSKQSFDNLPDIFMVKLLNFDWKIICFSKN
jgi:hypothetical protein